MCISLKIGFIYLTFVLKIYQFMIDYIYIYCVCMIDKNQDLYFKKIYTDVLRIYQHLLNCMHVLMSEKICREQKRLVIVLFLHIRYIDLILGSFLTLFSLFALFCWIMLSLFVYLQNTFLVENYVGYFRILRFWDRF